MILPGGPDGAKSRLLLDFAGSVADSRATSYGHAIDLDTCVEVNTTICRSQGGNLTQ